MNFKFCLYLFCCLFALGFASCLGNDDEIEYTYSSDAEILTFSLSRDSLSQLAKVAFTIDQLTGEIYNKDSMAFDVDTSYLRKVLMNYTTAGTYVCYVPSIKEDSAQINTGDGIDVVPVINTPQKYIRVYASDGSIKEYTLNLRIHTVDPDSMVYSKMQGSDLQQPFADQTVLWFGGAFRNFVNTGSGILYYSAPVAENLTWTANVSAIIPSTMIVKNIRVYGNLLVANATDGKLYTSSDGLSWTEITNVNGTPVSGVKAVLGELPGKGISLIVEESGNYLFVFTDLQTVWKKSSSAIPSGFPVRDFSSIPLLSNTSQLYVAGGYNQGGQPIYQTWILSYDLISWDALTTNPVTIEESNVFYYAGKFFNMNGLDGSLFNENVYISSDKGIYWTAPHKYGFAAGYQNRRNASVCVASDNTVYIFGGVDLYGVALTDVWKGRQNKMGFIY